MTPKPLHNFVNDLERNLTAAAAAEEHRNSIQRASRTALASPMPLIGIGALALVALVAIVLAITATTGTSTALGAPPATRLPVTPIPAQDATLPKDLRNAESLSHARSLAPTAPGAYVLPADGQWCLAVPDPKTELPTREYGVTCAPDAAFRRDGLKLSLVSGTDAATIVITPDGDTDPRIALANGTTKTVPATDGVIVVRGTYKPNDVLETTAADGTTRRTSLPEAIPTEPGPGDLRDCGHGRIVPLADGCDKR
jgi:hypothetical protein